MKRFVLALAAAAAVGLWATAAHAQYPNRGYYQSNYAPNYGVQVNNFYAGGNYGGGGMVVPYYGGRAAAGYYGGGSPALGYYQGNDPHSQAVRRIMATHSRYRYYTHPLSLQNSPPTQADYFGWGY